VQLFRQCNTKKIEKENHRGNEDRGIQHWVRGSFAEKTGEGRGMRGGHVKRAPDKCPEHLLRGEGEGRKGRLKYCTIGRTKKKFQVSGGGKKRPGKRVRGKHVQLEFLSGISKKGITTGRSL